MADPIKLSEAKPVGEWCYHTYKINNEYFVKECTEKEHSDLGLPNAKPPKLPDGAVWVNSSKGTRFDTASGFIENNQYAVIGISRVVKISGKAAIPVGSDKVVNGELDVETEAMIKAS